ncbi:autophagy-related protein 22-like protein [Naematelia encephala]|uniref:Autophagy-related protein n=1 Tax=Naematelia encephala TaxID=71784 RepID=A0A1Y2BE32_9TREE|nr:autophagy-related protein 22-like protein [Naematelia encephala]
MYVKSIAVAMQALFVVSVAPLADSAYWRKRLLVLFAYTGSTAGILLFLLPASPLLAGLLTIVGNIGYSVSIVCQNTFLPLLAREDPDVVSYGREDVERQQDGEGERLLAEGVRAISAEDLADRDVERIGKTRSTALSLATSRISSAGTALGFFAGVVVLALLAIPVSATGQSTTGLRLAVGLCGLWWAVFTVPAWLGLPGGIKAERGLGGGWWKVGWTRVRGMITPSEIRSLPNLFTFLFAWIFLSDGFHTTTYTAILYASSTLNMAPAKIIVVGVLVQLSAVFASIYAPRIQRWLRYSNQRLLVWIVIFAQFLPVYACLGLLLPYGGLRTEAEMYVAAVWFGLLLGPFSSYSRAVYAELIPPGHESSFFSLFSLTDKSASFLGPAIVGFIADTTGNIRLGFLFLLVLLAVPIPILLRVRPSEGVEEAKLWAERRTPTIPGE